MIKNLMYLASKFCFLAARLLRAFKMLNLVLIKFGVIN